MALVESEMFRYVGSNAGVFAFYLAELVILRLHNNAEGKRNLGLRLVARIRRDAPCFDALRSRSYPGIRGAGFE